MRLRNRHSPLFRVSIPSVAVLACLLLVPACASARRAESRERGARRSAAAPSTESTAPAQAPGSSPPEASPTPTPQESAAQPQRNTRPRGCRTTLAPSPPRTTAGETVVLSGALACRGGSPADVLVTVLERRRGGGPASASEVGTTSTASDGSFQFTSTAVSNNCIFLVRPALGHGARAVVRVAPQITLSQPAAAALLASRGGPGGAREKWTFTGTVDPAAVGTRVALQREYGAADERWHTFAVGHLGPTGDFAIVHGLRPTGAVSVRAVVHVKDDIAAASEPVSFEVTRAQNPALTIFASSGAVVSGQSLTITGVAPEAPNQEVTLLARTAGHRFTALSSATTDASGAYTFTASPSQNTYYRVGDAAARSSTLLEGFKYQLTTTAPPNTVHAGEPLSFTGTVIPAPAGQPVYLERQSVAGVGFHVVAVGVVDAADSYTIPYISGNGGAGSVMRVRVPANSLSQGSTGATFTLG
jgi:hypothetical protein